MSEADFRIVWSPESEADLLTIRHWGATRFSPDIADTHLRDIQKSVAALSAIGGLAGQRIEI